jgi:hypothetical protein
MWSLETERLLIVEKHNVNFDDTSTKSVLYLKEGVTLEQIIEDKEVLSKLRPIGEVKLEFFGPYCHIGYKILEEHRRNKYAFEALRALTLHCIQNGFIPRLLIESANGESKDVASRCGYSCDASEVDEYRVWTYPHR